jgi:hypothetical protein
MLWAGKFAHDPPSLILDQTDRSVSRWHGITEFLASRRNTSLLLVPRVLAGTGERTGFTAPA